MKKIILLLGLVIFGATAGFVSARFGGSGLSEKQILELAGKRGWVMGVSSAPDTKKAAKNWGNKYVSRQELANGFFSYDDAMETLYKDLRNVICLNKTNFINNLGEQNITDRDAYDSALWSLCGPWRPGFGVEDCAVGTGYNTLTGAAEQVSGMCGRSGPGTANSLPPQQ